MTHRQLAVQASLAAAGLVAAYFTWQRGVELAPGEVMVVDASKSDLAGVRFDDPEKPTWVELTGMSDENGSFIAVRLSAQEKPAPAKGGAKDKVPERTVRGSETAERFFASFAPLRASRGLGVLDEAKLKELGVATSQKRVTVVLRGGKRTFVITPAPPGGSEPYLRDEASGQVYVAGRTLLSDFQSAASVFIERRLHGFRPEEADRVVITVGATRREFVLSRDENGVRFSPAGTPDKPDTSAKTWHDRVFGIWPIDVLGKDEVLSGGVPEVKLRIDYSKRSRRLGFVEIAKLAAPAPVSTTGEGGKDRFFARSELTLGWVELSADSQALLDDAQAILR